MTSSSNYHVATTSEMRNWGGDMTQPNGSVELVCPACGLTYRGFNRRTMCRACTKLKVLFPSLFKKRS